MTDAHKDRRPRSDRSRSRTEEPVPKLDLSSMTEGAQVNEGQIGSNQKEFVHLEDAQPVSSF